MINCTIVDSIWIGGNYGMVFIVDENQYTKVFLGKGEGNSEEEDIQQILQNGYHINELVGKKITEHLKHAKKTKKPRRKTS